METRTRNRIIVELKNISGKMEEVFGEEANMTLSPLEIKSYEEMGTFQGTLSQLSAFFSSVSAFKDRRKKELLVVSAFYNAKIIGEREVSYLRRTSQNPYLKKEIISIFR